MTLAEKKAAIEKKKKEIKKDYGEKSILNGTEIPKTTFYETGIPSIDYALGGGFAAGRIISIYGEFSAGKSTLVVQTIKHLQEKDPNFTCMYIDQEQGAFTPEYLEKLGIDMERLEYVPKNDGEAIFDIIRKAVGIFNLIVLDSSNAIYPRERTEKEVGTNNEMAGTARILSKYIPTINLTSEDGDKTSLIVIEQVRDVPGARVMPGMPAPVAIGAGRAVGFYCSQRLMLKKSKQVKDGDDIIGNGVRFQCMKNKINTPLIKGETALVFGKGFDAKTDMEVFVENIFIENLGDDLEHLLDTPHFKQISKMKLQYVADNGDIIDISSKGKIKSILREKGLIEEAFKHAKELALENTKGASAKQDEYGIKDAAGEYLGELKEDEQELEPDV